MSKQIIKKFIGADAVDGSKIKLLNNQALRARNAANSADLSVIKLNASDDLVLNASEISMSSAVIKNISEMRAAQVKIGASQLAISEGSIAAAGEVDPHLSSVTALMHFDDAQYTDSSTSPCSLDGAPQNASIDAVNKKFGDGSLYRTANPLTTVSYTRPSSAPFYNGYSEGWPGPYDVVGGNDFSLEMWVKASDYDAMFPTLVHLKNPLSGGTFGIHLYVDSWDSGTGNYDGGRRLSIKLSNGNSELTVLRSGTGVMITNQWQHVAATKQGNVIRLFVDGVKVLEDTAAHTSLTCTSLNIGWFNGWGGQHFTGNIDDFRFTNGVCRYSDSFSPPTAAFGTAQAVPAINMGATEVLCSTAPSVVRSLANKAYVDNAIASVSGAAGAYNRYAYTIQSGDVSNGYVDLDDLIVHDSIVSGMNRQFMVGNGVDFSLTDIGGVTRMTFANDFASGGDIAIAAGDILYVIYRIA